MPFLLFPVVLLLIRNRVVAALVSVLCLMVLACGQARAQDWNTIIKRVAGDRENKTSIARAVFDYFGYSVSVSGDYAIVGTIQEDEDANGTNTLNNAGAAYIFQRVAGNWVLLKKITAPNRLAADVFGYSVAISGDYAIVGAHQEDEDANEANTVADAGSAYIFYRNQGGADNWGFQKKITAPTRAASDWFGVSVSISGDDVIVGASQEDEDASEANTLSAAGSAYIFSRNQGGTDTWGLVRKITAANRTSSDLFGYSVGISGDYAIVGAYQEDEDANEANPVSSAGAAYIFFRNQGGTDNWGQQKKITALNRSASDLFGIVVGISGDYVIVGANQEDEDMNEANTLSGAGAAYIFYRNQGGADNWGLQKKITAPVRLGDDYFGAAVSISGDYVIVGAPLEDEDMNEANAVSGAGAAYVFYRNQGGADNWGLQKKITAPNRTVSDNFGVSVAISGEYAIVGAYGEDDDESEINPVTDAGAAYSFNLNQGGANNWGQTQKVVMQDRPSTDNFGYSVAISGDYAIVGAYQEDEDVNGENPLNSAGAAYLLQRVAGNWTQIKKITAPNRAASDWFGYSVAISGDYVLVGAYWEDEDASEANPVFNAGAAYLFYKDQGGTNNWGFQKKIVAPVRATADNFGVSVSISGDYVIVGAQSEDEDVNDLNMISDAGAAYLFSRNQGGANNWGFQRKIVAPSRLLGDQFGFSVAISGEYAIVGAWAEDEDANEANTVNNAGAAYLFYKDQGGVNNWGLQRKIAAPSRLALDYFGISVAISGDYVIVGAYEEDEDANEANTINASGSAYVFYKDQGGANNWGLQKKITAPNRFSGDYFGVSVAISGEYAIVGAYWEDEDASEANTVSAAGSAYIFYKDQGGANNWGLQQKIAAPSRATNDYFGISVSISGNYAFVGAYQEDEDAGETNTLTNAGSVYFAERGSIFPVEWLSFEATPAGNTVALDWSTASEQNTASFTAERSLNGADFEDIGTIAAIGSSTTPMAYRLTDNALPAAPTLHYRIRQTDMDGNSSHSEIRTVTLDRATGLMAWPNPTPAQVTVRVPKGVFTLVLTDEAGRVIRTVPTTGQATTISLDLSGLASGGYILRAGAAAVRVVKE